MPDPAMTLCSILGRLVDDHGRIAVPGLLAEVEPPAFDIPKLPCFDESALAASARLVEGASLWGEENYSPCARMWYRPALVVTVLEGRPLALAAAAYIEKTVARVGLRTVPGMDGERAGRTLVDFLEAQPARGCSVTAKVIRHFCWWRVDPADPTIAAAGRALAAGFGGEIAFVGIGGSIGMLEPLSKRLGGAPFAIVGVEDPGSAAHAENEGLLVEEYRRMVLSLVFMLAELSKLPSLVALEMNLFL